MRAKTHLPTAVKQIQGAVNIKSVKLKALVRTSKEKNQTNDLTGDSYYKDGRKPVGRQTQMQW